MKYLAIPLLIFNLTFLAIFNDPTENLNNRTNTREVVKIDTFDMSLLHDYKKDTILTNAISLEE